MIDWNIQSRAQVCQGCARAFADQAPYHTLLFDEKQGYVRLDVCETCWQAQYSQGAKDRKGFVSHWQGTYAAPAPEPDPIARETAESLLRKLIEWSDPQYTAACFILAVMLERKRLLKVKDQIQRDGRRFFIYEQPNTGDVFTIEDPVLHLAQLDQVQRDVVRLLEQGLAAPAPSGPAPEPAVEAAPVESLIPAEVAPRNEPEAPTPVSSAAGS